MAKKQKEIKYTGVTSAVRTTARVVAATGRFCLSPLCLHVAGNVRCSRKCCRV